MINEYRDIGVQSLYFQRRLSGGPRQEELRRRAKQLLEQYTIEENGDNIIMETINTDSPRTSAEKSYIDVSLARNLKLDRNRHSTIKMVFIFVYYLF